MATKKLPLREEGAAETFRTLAAPCMRETVIERSRFIACAQRTDTRAASQSFLKDVGADHPGATHVCWAYRVRWPDRPEEHWSDAGEPSGTAGRPIHAALVQASLSNLTVLVVRYFGGTKLGVSGLIAAYGDAARGVLEAGEAVECQPLVDMQLQMPYGLYQTAKHHVEHLQGEIVESSFGDLVRCVARVPRCAEAEFAALTRSWGVHTEKMNNIRIESSHHMNTTMALRERSVPKARHARQP